MQTLVAILTLSFLIIIHEFGHFIVAKLSGIKVLEFSLFMGPKLLSVQKGETHYSIRLIPLGGYVKMEGEEEASDDERAYNKKPLGIRAAVLAAGPFMNLIAAVIIIVLLSSLTGYSTTRIEVVDPTSGTYEAGIREGDVIVSYDNKRIFHPADIYLFLFGTKGEPAEIEVMRQGEKKTFTVAPEVIPKNRYIIGFTPKKSFGDESNIIGNIDPNSPAYQAGLRPEDEIVMLDDTTVANNREIREFMNRSSGKAVKVTVMRDGQKLQFETVPITDVNEEQYDIGVYFASAKGNFIETVKYSFRYAYSVARNVMYSIIWLVTGRVSLSQLSGPIGIVGVIGDVVEQSPTFFEKFIGVFSLASFISINLGLVNLVPFPALDGSKLLLLAVEGIRKKPIPPEKEAFISFIGFVFLIILMIFSTYNDILRRVTGG